MLTSKVLSFSMRRFSSQGSAKRPSNGLNIFACLWFPCFAVIPGISFTTRLGKCLSDNNKSTWSRTLSPRNNTLKPYTTPWWHDAVTTPPTNKSTTYSVGKVHKTMDMESFFFWQHVKISVTMHNFREAEWICTTHSLSPGEEHWRHSKAMWFNWMAVSMFQLHVIFFHQCKEETCVRNLTLSSRLFIRMWTSTAVQFCTWYCNGHSDEHEMWLHDACATIADVKLQIRYHTVSVNISCSSWTALSARYLQHW